MTISRHVDHLINLNIKFMFFLLINFYLSMNVLQEISSDEMDLLFMYVFFIILQEKKNVVNRG